MRSFGPKIRRNLHYCKCRGQKQKYAKEQGPIFQNTPKDGSSAAVDRTEKTQLIN